MWSPPRRIDWGLRDYGTGTWEGGDAGCDHVEQRVGMSDKNTLGPTGHLPQTNAANVGKVLQYRDRCGKCGAVRTDQQLGSEATPGEHVEAMVGVFDEVRRVLRDDGVCWVNYGDSYAAGTSAGRNSGNDAVSYWEDNGDGRRCNPPGLASGQQCLVPHRFALAMQEAGWILRSTIVWAKGLSFCAAYSGSVMPESLGSTRWERCRGEKIKAQRRNTQQKNGHQNPSQGSFNDRYKGKGGEAEYIDCPGCDKCRSTNGLVLRRGSWRPTSAFEYVFMFVKSMGYWSDGEAVREAAEFGYSPTTRGDGNISAGGIRASRTVERGDGTGGRNLRNVWAISPQPYPDAHFATYPQALVEPCIKAATSERGCCPQCGAQWARVIQSEAGDRARTRKTGEGVDSEVGTKGCAGEIRTQTLGWLPTCACDAGAAIPCTVLDPFGGSGTTALVAEQMGRRAILCELNPVYAAMAQRRLDKHGAPLFREAAP